MRSKAFLFMLSLFLTNLSFSAEDPEKKGFFWYEDAVTETKEELEIEEKYPKPSELPSYSEMMAKHPKELQAMLDERRDYAVYTLDPEDLTNFYKVQDVIRRKSAAFTSVAATVLLNNPELNPNIQNPVTRSGRTTLKRNTESVMNKRLIAERENYALGFFVSQTCGFCQDQKPSLKLFQDKNRWDITTIDINERPDLAERFGVTVTPMLVLIKRDSEKWMTVAVGLEPLSKIEQNAYKSIRLLENEIDTQQFNTNELQEGGYFDTGNEVL